MKEPLPGTAADLLQSLQHILPEAFTEEKLDTEKLMRILNMSTSPQSEKYELNWAGKAAAYQLLQQPASATLVPVFEKSVDWDTTGHILIEGENLEVLKVLQEAYIGKIKGIYIDPPYNTGSGSFVYADRFHDTKADYLKKIDTKNAKELLTNRNLNKPDRKENGHFHSNWLSMMLPRLVLARNLLREDGFIAVSIDDKEVANLKLIMDEVFGEENYIDTFSWVKSETPANLSKKSKKIIEYVLYYQKVKNNERFKGVKKNSPSSNGLLNQTNNVGVLRFPAHRVTTSLPNGVLQKGRYGTVSYQIELLEDTLVENGFFIEPVALKAKFKWSQPKLDNEIENGTRISIPTLKLSPSYEKLEYSEEVPPNLINSKVGVGTNENATAELEKLFGTRVFDFPKPPSLVKYLLGFSDDPNGIFLDFFAGSGATAQAVLEMNQRDGGNRKYICVQMAEKIRPGTIADQQGFYVISDITHKRLLLLHSNLHNQATTASAAAQKMDTGFRYFKLVNGND